MDFTWPAQVILLPSQSKPDVIPYVQCSPLISDWLPQPFFKILGDVLGFFWLVFLSILGAQT